MIDFEKLKQVYNFGKHFTMKEMNIILKASKRKTFNKKEFLLKPGSTSNELFFVRKGLVRVYKLNDKLEEITMSLNPENSIISNSDFFLFDEPCTYYYEAYEKTKTLSIDYEVVNSLINSNPILAENRQQVFLKFLKSMFRKIESFVLYTPEERYLKYLEMYPDISNRVPDKHIANVLGITPVSLSRIRKRLAEK
jgi:CRP-like cAMP-binding protein